MLELTNNQYKPNPSANKTALSKRNATNLVMTYRPKAGEWTKYQLDLFADNRVPKNKRKADRPVIRIKRTTRKKPTTKNDDDDQRRQRTFTKA